jgi:26S proteasome regulatory subunit N5
MTATDEKVKKGDKAKKNDDIEDRINDIITEGTGKEAKMEVDYSETVAKKIPEYRALAAENLTKALEMLLGLEKQTRTGGDMHSTSKVLTCIVQLCFEAKNWNALNEHIVILTKKRNQLKQAVAKMVQECCKWIKEGNLPSRELELELIGTLRTVTEGKIYVEVDRSRLTHRLAMMKEEDGQVAEAAKIMHELQVILRTVTVLSHFKNRG